MPPQSRSRKCADTLPFMEALVRANPERLVWGGDWPHPRMETEMPDGGLVRAVPSPDAATRARILV
jgi:2-pyrone-4,6-dicarboxylate lactonase